MSLLEILCSINILLTSIVIYRMFSKKMFMTPKNMSKGLNAYKVTFGKRKGK